MRSVRGQYEARTRSVRGQYEASTRSGRGQYEGLVRDWYECMHPLHTPASPWLVCNAIALPFLPPPPRVGQLRERAASLRERPPVGPPARAWCSAVSPPWMGGAIVRRARPWQQTPTVPCSLRAIAMHPSLPNRRGVRATGPRLGISYCRPRRTGGRFGSKRPRSLPFHRRTRTYHQNRTPRQTSTQGTCSGGLVLQSMEAAMEEAWRADSSSTNARDSRWRKNSDSLLSATQP